MSTYRNKILSGIAALALATAVQSQDQPRFRSGPSALSVDDVGNAGREIIIRVPYDHQPINVPPRPVITPTPPVVTPTPTPPWRPRNAGEGPTYLGFVAHNCGPGCGNFTASLMDDIQPEIVRTGPWLDTTQGLFFMDPTDPMMEAIHSRGTQAVINVGWENQNDFNYQGQLMQRLQQTMDTFQWVDLIQMLNEPKNFDNMSPEYYVNNVLKPARQVVDAENAKRAQENTTRGSGNMLPYVKIASAGWFGQNSGIDLTKAAIRAGMENYIDIMGAHIYGDAGDTVKKAKAYRAMTRLPIIITETGVNSHGKHVDWYMNRMAAIENALGGRSWPDKYGNQQTQWIIWYDANGGDPDGFALVEHIRAKTDGTCCTYDDTSTLEQMLRERQRN